MQCVLAPQGEICGAHGSLHAINSHFFGYFFIVVPKLKNAMEEIETSITCFKEKQREM